LHEAFNAPERRSMTKRKAPEDKLKTGRPSLFEKYEQIILKIAKYGLTEKQIADSLGINIDTITNWKKANPEFFVTLKRIKEESDETIKKSLYNRALGYSYDEVIKETKYNKETGEDELVVTKVITKHVVPDTTAQIFWLKNRQPQQWRDKQEVDLTVKELPKIVIKRAENDVN